MRDFGEYYITKWVEGDQWLLHKIYVKGLATRKRIEMLWCRFPEKACSFNRRSHADVYLLNHNIPVEHRVKLEIVPVAMLEILFDMSI